MSLTRKLIIAFWIFIGVMLVWQFYTYNRGMTQEAVDHPKQTQFWFTNSPAGTAPATSGHRDGADVEQTRFDVQNNTPSTGSFTCLVTLKNKGNAKAVGIQVHVRPYRGIPLGDEDVGHTKPGTLSDDDPVSQFGTWVTFPDLGPGESSTQSAVFAMRVEVKPGNNPHPEILFQTEKAH